MKCTVLSITIIQMCLRSNLNFHLHVWPQLPKEDSGDVQKMRQLDFNVDAADVVSSWIAQTE